MNTQAILNEASRNNIDPNQPDVRACSPTMHQEADLSQFEQPVKVIKRGFVNDWGLFVVVILLIITIGFTTANRA